MKTQTKLSLENLTPKDAHELLVNGNKRFVQNLKAQRDLQSQVLATSHGQYPFGVILSCIDSRVPAELVFDQGIGDIFSIRVAGNVINNDVLGSMEYACKVTGSKIVVVLGHTSCGAVTAACKDVKMGHITELLEKIKPAIALAEKEDPSFVCDYHHPEVVDHIAVENIHISIDRIRKESPILAELEKNGEIEIVGALYSVQTGEVEFFPW
ncbi:MAG TPA: carbonic anhydrase [Saprospiraceae bacterium]|nr:carbonic anhydrase [Saprospiraceae bacterium]